MKCREARVEDIEALFEIRCSVRENHLSREELAEMGITAQALADVILRGESVWVASDGERLLGFAMVDADNGELFALFVRPECEGRGVGARLLALAEARLFRDHPVACLITDGREQMRAFGFYLRAGWRVVRAEEGGDVRMEKSRPAG